MTTEPDPVAADGTPDVVLSGRVTPDEAQRYVHVPFEVPPGLRQIHLRCAYTDRICSDPTLSGGNTLDIGLFDERGTEGGGPGFRGWSGSELLSFTIAEDWATPPYQPGSIGAGVWNVLLGPYKVGPRGLDYTIGVFFDPGIPPEARSISRPVATPATLPPPAEAGWVRGDLHCHTRHSDGDSWPEEVLADAAAAGLDFLGITDHNAARPHDPPPHGSRLPLLVPGVEVTTYGGHWNAWGGGRWYDFREPDGAKVGGMMRQAAADGAFVSVNHPRPLGPPWSYPDATGYHAIEVWNGPWLALNAVSLGVWDAHLRRGERVIAVGGSDTHYLRPRPDRLFQARLGQPTTWVETGDAPLSVASILAALKAGRSFVSAAPGGPQVYLARPEPGIARVRVVGAAGGVVLLISAVGPTAAEAIRTADFSWNVRLAGPTPYVRAQVMDPNGSALALSNPVWSLPPT